MVKNKILTENDIYLLNFECKKLRGYIFKFLIRIKYV